MPTVSDDTAISPVMTLAVAEPTPTSTPVAIVGFEGITSVPDGAIFLCGK